MASCGRRCGRQMSASHRAVACCCCAWFGGLAWTVSGSGRSNDSSGQFNTNAEVRSGTTRARVAGAVLGWDVRYGCSCSSHSELQRGLPGSYWTISRVAWTRLVECAPATPYLFISRAEQAREASTASHHSTPRQPPHRTAPHRIASLSEPQPLPSVIRHRRTAANHCETQPTPSLTRSPPSTHITHQPRSTSLGVSRSSTVYSWTLSRLLPAAVLDCLCMSLTMSPVSTSGVALHYPPSFVLP